MTGSVRSSGGGSPESAYRSFVMTGINVVGSSPVPAVPPKDRPHSDGSPRVALGLIPYDVRTGPKKTLKANLNLYSQPFSLQYLLFDTPVQCSVAQTYADRLSDIASVTYMATGNYASPLAAVGCQSSIGDLLLYSDMAQPSPNRDPITEEPQDVIELLRFNCWHVADTTWDAERASCWQTVLNSLRLSTVAHFLRASMNSYWTDLIYWEEDQRFGVGEKEIDPAIGDTAYQNAFKGIEEIVGGKLPSNLAKARQKLERVLAGTYGVDTGTPWQWLDAKEECSLTEAVLKMLRVRNDRTAHGGTAYKQPLKESQILEGQYLARHLLLLCSENNPSHASQQPKQGN